MNPPVYAPIVSTLSAASRLSKPRNIPSPAGEAKLALPF